jgi:hypothetical protein
VTGTYWYVLVRTRNKTWGFLIHPGSAPKVNCNSVHFPCKRYDMMLNFKKCKVQIRKVHTGMCWYVQVRTGIDINNPHTSFRCCFRRSPMQVSLHCTLDLFHARNAFPQSSLLHRETAQNGLAAPNIQSQVLTSYILLPRLPSASAVLALPMGKPDPLCLLKLCWIVCVELPARIKEMKNIVRYCIDLHMLVHTSTYW